MTSSFDNETNQVEDEYYGEEEDDLDDFIVHTDDDEDKPVKKQKLHRQQDEEDQEEEEEEEEFEEDEEEEAPVGMQEILSLREQLKEKIRRKNAAMAAGVDKGSSSSVKQQTEPPARDRFGTFFGPSRQSLAPRVIQEGCSSMMKELQNASRKNDASLVSKAQPDAGRSLSKPKTVSEERKKADALRENRDYSSLFSEDAESSPSRKEQTGNKPGVQVRVPVNSSGKNRVPNDSVAKSLFNGQGLKDAAPSSQGRVQKVGSPGKFSIADRKGAVAAARNGFNSAAMKKTTGSQPSHQSKRQQQQSCQGQKLQPPSQSLRPQSNGQHQIRKHASSVQDQRSGQKQLAPTSKLKASRLVEKGAAKRKSDDQFDYSSISKEIGALFGYDRSKYVGIDDDDRNMEADYASILKEERRSAKLARQEDQEQLRLIEEEERRERAKKRKKASTKAREEVA